jgi:hypothetical protein
LLLARTVVAALRSLPRRELTWTLALLLVGLGLRLLEPTRLVMIYSAYEWTDQVARFTGIGRYGASTTVLYRLLFSLVPPDHEAIVTLHRAAGALTLPVLAALLARCWPPPGAVALFTLLLAALPLFVRDHATESILVPIVLWLSAGLLLLDRALQEQTPGPAAAAAVFFLGLALTGRPEMIAVVPMLAAALVLVRRGLAGWRWLLGGGALLGLLGLPHLLHIRAQQTEMAAHGALALLDHSYWQTLANRGLSAHIAFHPKLFPTAVTALALLSLRHPAGRKVRLAVLALTLLWLAVVLVDLPNTSIARLQAPLAMLWTALAAWGLAAEMQRRRPRMWLAGGTAAVALTALPTHQHLRLWTNEDQTEHLWRRALPQLPDRGACLVALTARDQPEPGKVQRAVPAYLLRPPHRQLQLVPLDTWLSAAPPCPSGAFLLVDPRCYASYHRPPGLPPLLSSCAAALERAEPLDAWTLANLGDNEYGYYGDIQRFQVGLYRLWPGR